MKDKEDLAAKILRALSTTNNTSTPGPNRISYCLLKLLKGTKLGTQVVHILAKFLRGKTSLLLDFGDGREITVVMIPKTGKDHSQAKGWRPIVLINCLLKLMDKVVANELQNLPVFHHGQYGSRKGKSAMDMVIQATTEALWWRRCAEVFFILFFIFCLFIVVWLGSILYHSPGVSDD